MFLFWRRSTTGEEVSDNGGTVDPDGVRAELERVLAAGSFRGSDRHRRFLRFVVEEVLEGRGDSVKESVVAAEVFGRTSEFDSRTDSVVRVEARNLRTRLNEYYLGEGSGDPAIIELPKGTYVPVFRAARGGGSVRPQRPWRLALVALLVPVLGGAAWWTIRQGPEAFGLGGSPSVAVLPFLNLASGPEEQFFADGLVEDLTTDLGSLRGLRVAARTSAFQFRDRSEDVRRIGRQLGVAAVLEGSVRRQGSQVRITAQLISTRDGYHLWARVYERDTAGVEDAEREIWRAVAGTLGVRVTPLAAAPHVPPPEAREAYWRGRYLRGDWQEPLKAIGYFERAVTLDPQFAEAWAALATAHSGLAFQLIGRVDEEAERAREAARKALVLDQTVAEAHLALAALGYSYDRDWPASERAFRRALDLNGNSAGAHRAYALALTAHGRFQEAIAQLKVAQELDPLSIVATNNLAVTLYVARRYDEAIQTARRHLEMDPRFSPAHMIIGNSYAQQGRWVEAVKELEKGTVETERPVEFLGDLGAALARAGRLEEARAIEAELEGVQRTRDVAGVALAKIHAARGEPERAIEWLRRAADAHVANAIFIGVDPAFDALRSQAEFRKLCARLGVPDGSTR